MSGFIRETISPLLAKLKSLLKELRGEEEKWVDLFPTLSEEQRKAEEKIHEDTSDNPEGLIKVLEIANANLVTLNGDIRAAEEYLQRRNKKKDADKDQDEGELIDIPKIKLGTFSGDVTEWPEFWQRFNNAIKMKKNLSDRNKLTYLISALQGEARKAVKGYSLTDENFPIVLQKLEDTFGQSEQLTTALRTKLTKLPKATDAKSSINTLREIESILQQLNTQGATVDLYSIEGLIGGKLPWDIVDRIYTVKETSPAWSMSVLRQTLGKLDKHLAGLEHMLRESEPEDSSTSSSGTNNSKSSRQDKPKQSGQPKAKPKNVEPKKTSVFVSITLQNHYSDNCKTYSSKSARITKAVDNF
uniref:Uncharacterized protein n=1 Tax=Syphacia muris TaxID=451379 RepID=A0A0N5B1N8_9BILA